MPGVMYPPTDVGVAAVPTTNGADLTALNASALSSGTVPNGRFPATLPAANGAALTALNASALGSGTVPDARFPATLPAASGANLTNLPGVTATPYGVYTPTLTNTLNLDASAAFQCQWTRTQSGVLVSGIVTADPTAAGLCELGIELPIASDFGANEDCGGVAFAPAVAGQGAGILADTTNNRMLMRWTAVDTANRGFMFIALYRIL